MYTNQSILGRYFRVLKIENIQFTNNTDMTRLWFKLESYHWLENLLEYEKISILILFNSKYQIRNQFFECAIK